MKKIVHIHSDHKFVSDTGKFDGEYFNNELIILDTRHEHNQRYHNKAQFFPPVESELPNILEQVKTADIIVIYELDFFKSLIVNAVDPGVKIIWRFFGYELYFRKLHLYLDPETRAFCKSEIIKRRTQSRFHQFFIKEKTFRAAIKRVDILAGVFKDEYDELVKIWPNLPPFVRIPLYNEDEVGALEDLSTIWPKENTIVIGNSRSFFNNHCEILNLVEKADVDPKVKLKILFNYGEENRYTDHIRKKVLNLPNVELIDRFVPYNEFLHFYDKVSAVVNNSYRQHALGNIFQSLRTGVKVYLNPKSPTFKWMQSLGFNIFDIAWLKNDLAHGNISLKAEEAMHNINTYKNVLYDYTKADFQESILSLLNIPFDEHSGNPALAENRIHSI